MSDLTIRPVTIRPVTEADRAAWQLLFSDYLAFYETSRPEAVFDTAFARLLSDDPQEFSGLLAELDGEIVGLTHYLFHRHMWSEANTCYLQDLFVAEPARGAGAGRALIEAVHDRAARSGATGVYWLTQDFNHTARRLYDEVAELTPFIKYNMPVT